MCGRESRDLVMAKLENDYRTELARTIDENKNVNVLKYIKIKNDINEQHLCKKNYQQI